MIGGVCAGLGEYLGLDPTIVRIVWVLMVLFAGVGILLNYLFPNPSWITFVGKVLLISVVYGLSIIIFGLNEYEKGKFLQFYKRIGSFFKNLIDNVVK